MDEILSSRELSDALSRHGRPLVREEVRRALSAVRGDVEAGRGPSRAEELEHLAREAVREATRRLDLRAHGRLREVLNATGVLVHTNLGRAPLGEPAVRRLAERAAGVNLEIDLDTGRRGPRAAGVEELLKFLTGAEAASVVNNNAAALLLALSALARGGPVIVSRGELVEIGGSFRIPDICERSGVRLIEVGTTNRTRLSDYREAVDACAGASRALLLKVHPSNFRVVGFTEETSLRDLVELGRSRDVPVVMDQGSGALTDLSPWGVEGETPVPELVATGADLVLFSGDKLLGGPQAGCLVGRREAVATCARNPLYRALRPGRLVLAALEATLWSHAAERFEEIPVLEQLRLPAETVRRRAEVAAAALASAPGGDARMDVVPGSSTSGGGSSPTSRIPTFVLRIRGADASRTAHALRTGSPAVLARIEDDALLVDFRTVPPARDADVVSALRAALGNPVEERAAERGP